MMRIMIRLSLLLACCLSMTLAAQSPQPQIADGHPGAGRPAGY